MICLISNFTIAQGDQRHLFGVQYGFQRFAQQNQEKEFIRQSSNKHFYPNFFDLKTPRTTKRTFGVSDEIDFNCNFLRIVIGVNYAQFDTFFNDPNQSNADGVMAILVNKTDDSIDFLNVESIIEKSHYLIFPLALKINVITRSNFQFYLKPGIEFNFRLGNKRSVDFLDDEQRSREKQVLNLFDKTDKYFNSILFTSGFRFIKRSHFILNIEADLGYRFLNESISDMVSLKGGKGLKCLIQIPIHSN